MKAIIIKIDNATGVARAIGEDCKDYMLYQPQPKRQDFRTGINPGEVVEIEPVAGRQLIPFTTTGRRVGFSKDGEGLPVESSQLAALIWRRLANALSRESEKPLPDQGAKGYRLTGL